ncbi:MAG: 5-formyltetrahydrofolate cyclo-ligase [Phycisphaerae bacterium]
MNNLKTEKEQLRKDIRDLLRQMTSDQRQNWSGIITGKILELPEYQQAKTIMVFLSLAREYDTMDFIAIALKAGKIVCAPKVNWPAWSMEPVQLESIEDMAADEHNLKEPTGNKKIFPDTIDLILTPGLAFDLAGHRVGRGGDFTIILFPDPICAGLGWLRLSIFRFAPACPSTATINGSI